MHKKLNRRLVSTLIILCAVRSVRSASASDFSAVDVQVASATERISKLQSLAHGFGSAKDAKKRCLESFSVDAMINSSLAASRAPSTNEENEQTVSTYLACHAVQSGATAVCDAWALTPDREVSSCTDLVQHLAMGKIQAMAASDPVGAKRFCALVMKGVPAGFCDLYVDNASDVRQRYAKLSPLFPGMTLEVFEARERANMGLADANTCRAFKKDGWPQALSCTTMRAFRAASLKKDPAACGDSGLCLALMGQRSGSCEVYSDSLRDAYCVKKAATDWTDGKTSLSSSVQGEQANLKALLQTVENTPKAEGASLRRRRLTELFKQCDKIARELAGLSSAPRSPAKDKKSAEPN